MYDDSLHDPAATLPGMEQYEDDEKEIRAKISDVQDGSVVELEGTWPAVWLYESLALCYEIYQPFAVDPEYYWFAFEEQEEGFVRTDESGFYCDQCNRQIHFDNGFRNNVKVKDGGEICCVKCWQDEILEEGLPDDSYTGDFFSKDDLVEHGWGKAIEDFFISTDNQQH